MPNSESPEAVKPPKRAVLKTKRVKLASLVLDEKNPMEHDELNLATIQKSLEEHGQVEFLVVQASTMWVIGGNGRAEVMRRMGWEDADVVLMDIDDKAARALSIRLNRSAQLARWDIKNLTDALRELEDDFPLTDFGWTDSEVKAMLDDIQPSDVNWKTFDETIGGDDDAKPKDGEGKPEAVKREVTVTVEVTCPHCGGKFKP